MKLTIAIMTLFLSSCEMLNGVEEVKVIAVLSSTSGKCGGGDVTLFERTVDHYRFIKCGYWGALGETFRVSNAY